MNAIKLTRKQAQPILKATFPDYNGRKIRLVYAEKITFSDTNWGGGSRNKYMGYRLDTAKAEMFNAPAPWNNPVEGATVEMPLNGVVVCHSHFCGQDVGITIYVHPDHAPKLLTQ